MKASLSCKVFPPDFDKLSKIIELLLAIMKSLYNIGANESIAKARRLYSLLAGLQVKARSES